jgi:hypothetical protein
MTLGMSAPLTSRVPPMSTWPRTKNCGTTVPRNRTVVPSGNTNSEK